MLSLSQLNLTFKLVVPVKNPPQIDADCVSRPFMSGFIVEWKTSFDNPTNDL